MTHPEPSKLPDYQEKNQEMKTHPNLKSLVNGVQTAEEMENMIGTALSYQDMFDHRTSPWEMHKWEQ
ncbi:hypothetical protein Hamer_G016595, partial [Homarus americanus]